MQDFSIPLCLVLPFYTRLLGSMSSLLEEWDSSGAAFGEPGVSGDLLEDVDNEIVSPRSTQQTIFALETVERHISR